MVSNRPFLSRRHESSLFAFSLPVATSRLAVIVGAAVMATAACSSTPGPSEKVGTSSADLTAPGSGTCKPGFCGGAGPVWARKNKHSDVNGDLRSGIVLTGGSGIGNACAPQTWTTIPVAISKGDGGFVIGNAGVANFPGWTAGPAMVVMGDFDGDGRADLAATGVAGWSTIPVAFSNGDGTFRVVNDAVSGFPSWATSSTFTKAVSGDFDGDGKADIAITGGNGWGTQPIAFSNGDGTFRVTNLPIQNFATWGFNPAAHLVSADFNNDGKDDLALVGGADPTTFAPWTTIPVAFSNGDGSFRVTNQPITNFATWAAAGAGIVAGDFNGDGYGDVALAGGPGWGTIPVAFGKGDGTFNVSNLGVSNFPGWASAASALVAGDFNDDGKTDLALTGGIGWSTIPVAFSNGDGTFGVTNDAVANFPGWAVPWHIENPGTSWANTHLTKALSGSSDNMWKAEMTCSPASPPPGGGGTMPPGSGGGMGPGSGSGGVPTCGLPDEPCCSGTCQAGAQCADTGTGTGQTFCDPCGGLGQTCCSTPGGPTCGYGLKCQVNAEGYVECDGF